MDSNHRFRISCLTEGGFYLTLIRSRPIRSWEIRHYSRPTNSPQSLLLALPKATAPARQAVKAATADCSPGDRRAIGKDRAVAAAEDLDLAVGPSIAEIRTIVRRLAAGGSEIRTLGPQLRCARF
jgi:hypothetical protein